MMKKMGISIVSVVMTLSSIFATAVETVIWEQNTYKDFSKGKSQNVSISSKNEITLSQSLTPIGEGISEPRIWCLAQDSKGNIYAGTGDKGKILKIDLENKVSVLFDSPETDILCLVVDDKDNIYAGSSPDGIIYKISPDRIPETFFISGEKYIWSLAFDRSGNLYAGTGTAGKLYKITPDGKGEVIYDSPDTHIKSLLSRGDDIYAGSESEGIIYRVSYDGQVFVVYDTDQREISSLVTDGSGNIYASAVSGEPSPPGKEGEPPQQQAGKEERKAMIYMITPDNVVNTLWESPEPIIFAMLPVEDGTILVGTGNAGNIYSVDSMGEWALISDCEESQVLSLIRSSVDKDIWIATGNPGKIYKLSKNFVKEGFLESDRFDTSLLSKWGAISWEAITPTGTKVTLSTRSGNTKKPDDTWSKWSEEYTMSGSAISSPPARFIQWKAKLTSDNGNMTPILKRVSIAYLPKNLRPEIRTITITEERERTESPQQRTPQSRPGEEEQQVFGSTAFSGKKAIKWQAKDPNNDSLQFSVYIRGVEETKWKLLKDEIKTNSYTLDTESLPDGRYLVKVVASDILSNPKELALTNDMISDIFTVDNTPPEFLSVEISAISKSKYEVSGTVKDATSMIKGLSYSVDSKEWVTIFPEDQIFDSNVERFSFEIEIAESGEHTIVIKGSDYAGNTTAIKTTTTVPEN